jgi:hypothetical protein
MAGMNAAYGKIVSLADAIELCVPVANRRREVRRKPSDVRWLRSARLKYGPDVDIIDISDNGILIRSRREMSANDTIVFEVSGTTGTLLVVARVLRSRRVASGDLPWFETACRFKRPVAFPKLVAEVRGRSAATARIVQLNAVAR